MGGESEGGKVKVTATDLLHHLTTTQGGDMKPETKEFIADILAIPMFLIVFFGLFIIGWALTLPPV